MVLRLGSLAAVSCIPLALAQSSTNSTINAPSISAAPIATVLADTGYIPSALIDVAATYVASAANGVQTALIEALSKPGVDPEKLSDPELYYSYGHSPPVYPSRTYQAYRGRAVLTLSSARCWRGRLGRGVLARQRTCVANDK